MILNDSNVFLYLMHIIMNELHTFFLTLSCLHNNIMKNALLNILAGDC